MWASALTAYGHYLSIGLIFAALSTELFTLKSELSIKEAWRIVIADTIYGIAAVAILGTGILRLLYFAKETSYYMHQPVFWLKMGVYALIGVLSLYPTISFIQWVIPLRAQKVPEVSAEKVKRLKTIIHLELLGFTFIPLFASMMARGIGSDWFNI